MKKNTHKPITIISQTIDHKDQDYDTCGDYYEQDNGLTWRFKISNLNNIKYEILVLIHELIEKTLCKEAGISDEEITKFDKKFVREKKRGKHKKCCEPGNCEKSPYAYQHCLASLVERFASDAMKVHWDEYEEAINRL